MTVTLPLPKSAVESSALTLEATDESLIDTARELNASYKGHLRRSIEDFWRLGQTLSHLFQRRHLQGRWADILAEIGINITTDNQARRLYRDSTIEGLAEFKNKTAALRALGILSTPTPSAKVRGISSLDVSPESGEYTGSPGGEQITAEPDGGADRDRLARAERSEGRITKSKQRRSVETAQGPADSKAGQSPPIAGQANVQGTADPLERLAIVAAQMEYLAADLNQVTPDHLAQIDRLLVAIDLIRSKGVVDAA